MNENFLLLLYLNCRYLITKFLQFIVSCYLMSNCLCNIVESQRQAMLQVIRRNVQLGKDEKCVIYL